MMPPKKGKRLDAALVFAEAPTKPESLSPRLEPDYDGETVVLEAIDACVDSAVANVEAKLKTEMATLFAVATLNHSCWTVLAMVPPILAPDVSNPLGRLDTAEPEPGMIDAWASLYLSTMRPRAKPLVEDIACGRTSSNNFVAHDAEHRGSPTRSGSEFLSTLPRVLPQVEIDWNGRRSMSRPTSAGSSRRPSSANRRPASASLARRELFKLADTENRGMISAEDLHEWLSLQSAIPFSEVKKLLDVMSHPHSQPLGAGIFADILGLLQKANPRRWMMENLTVFALPKAKSDPQLSVDARELKEILNPAHAAKPRVEEFAPLTSTPDKGFASSCDAPTFGTNNIIDDRIQLTSLTPQIIVSNTMRASTAPAKDNATRTSKSTRRLQSSQPSSRLPVSNMLTHSHSQPILGSTPRTPLVDSAKFVPHHFRQMSLVENFEFVPEAGVSATDSVANADASPSSKCPPASRAGPPWPSNPNHMTRSAFDSLKTLERPGSATRIGNAAEVTVSEVRGASRPIKSKIETPTPTRDSLRSIGGRAGGGDGGGSVTTSAFRELLNWGPNAHTKSISLIGGKQMTHKAGHGEIIDDHNQVYLLRLEEVEASIIHELRGEDAAGKKMPNFHLPAYAADVRSLQKLRVLEGRNVANRERTHNHPIRMAK